MLITFRPSRVRAVVHCLGTVSLLACHDEPTRPEIAHRVSAPPRRSGTLVINGVTDLGTLGGANSIATAINSFGNVVGASDTPGAQHHAFLWASGTMTDLGTLGGNVSVAAGINAAGQVVGFSLLNDNSTSRAFLWQNGTMTDLGTLGGTDSEAHAINSSGQIVGQADVGGGAPHPFLWQNGTMIDLGTLGGCCGGAHAINDAGVVVGWSITADGHDRDFIWQNGVMTELPTLGGENGSDGAASINANGVVVGPSNTSFGPVHPYLWQNGVITDLGVLPSGIPINVSGRAQGVNDSNLVAGWSGASDGQYATVWAAGVISALPSLATTSNIQDAAFAINNAGQIVGHSQIAQGQTHAALWSVSSAAAAGTTPPGTNVTVSPAIGGAASTSVTLTFSTVIAAGITTLTTSPPNSPPPGGFQLGSPATYYDLTTTASFTGAISVCIDYEGTTFQNLPEIRLFHGDGSGGWTDVTTSLDESTTTICGSVTSLSPFAIAEPVPLNWSGFFAPVINPPVLNVAKAGSSIPIKFSLGGNQGLGIFASGTPIIASIACGASSTVSIGDASTAGASGLHYDAATDQYTYVWKTNKALADSCRQFVIELTDGTTHVANFKFTR